jgi:hypothetical protein
VAAVLDTYGTRCHLCGHEGAESADHLVPRSDPDRGRALMYVVGNGRPAHHKPCPVCGVRCQLRRKDKPITTAPPLDRLTFFETPR